MKNRSPLNRTLTLSEAEQDAFLAKTIQLTEAVPPECILDKIIHQDLFTVLDWLPARFVDLLYIDPPYNLDKQFNDRHFKGQSIPLYTGWLESWLPALLRVLKPTGSVYICGDWRSSAAIHTLLEGRLRVRNRITWEREKGRGAIHNWKNCSEDIWFCTASEEYTFNVDAVKLKRRVIAPYTAGGEPKDWLKTEDGNFRLTAPSNLWTDLTIPFWSMPENTDHPTQKPEKLLAKIVLASSNPGDVVFDPFLGSGTAAVVAKKLNRHYVGVEVDPMYCALSEKRLALAEDDRVIQGYANGVFWERNSFPDQRREKTKK